jgi:hypothetical protein
MLMAPAQDGDREAYRRLLTEVEPCIRSIATSGRLPCMLADGPFRNHQHIAHSDVGPAN